MRVKIHVQSPARAAAQGRLTLAQALDPFLMVLSVSGMTSATFSDGTVARRGAKVVYSAALFVLTCVSTSWLCWSLCRDGMAGVSGAGAATAGFTRTLVQTGFFGLAPFIFAFSAAMALTLGNHRVTGLLRRLQEVSSVLEVIGDYQALMWRIRRIGQVLAVVLVIVNCFPVLGILAAVVPACASLDSLECFKHNWAVMFFAVPWMVFNAMSFKLVFFASCLSRCFDHIDRKLHSLNDQFENDFSDQSDVVHFLCVTHRRLSQTYELLLRASAAELIPFMFFGVAGPVYFSMLGVIMISDAIGAGQWSSAVFGVVTCLIGGIIFALAIYMPCEASQRVINSVERIRSTLWDLRMNNDHLEQKMALYFEQLSHDRDTMGDVRLFRLQRATTTSCMTVTATYIIVLLQFLTGGGSEPAAVPAVSTAVPPTAAAAQAAATAAGLT